MVKPASSMNDMKETKTNFCFRYRWPILILGLILIAAIIGIIIAVVLTRHQFDSTVNSIANISIINYKYNVSIEKVFLPFSIMFVFDDRSLSRVYLLWIQWHKPMFVRKIKRWKIVFSSIIRKSLWALS